MKRTIVSLAVIALCVSFLSACSKGHDFGIDSDNPIASKDRIIEILKDDGVLRNQPTIRKKILSTGKTQLFQVKKQTQGIGEVYIVTDDSDKVIAIVATYIPLGHMWIQNFVKIFWETHGGTPKPEFSVEFPSSGFNPAKFSAEFSGEQVSGKWVKYSSDPEFLVIALNEYKDEAFKVEFH